MGIDTENKRRSAPNFYLFVLAPVPDSVINAADREQITGIYGGFAPTISVGWMSNYGWF